MPRFASGSGNTTRRETTVGAPDAGVDQDRDVLDILVQSRPDVRALREDVPYKKAEAFFAKEQA